MQATLGLLFLFMLRCFYCTEVEAGMARGAVVSAVLQSRHQPALAIQEFSAAVIARPRRAVGLRRVGILGILRVAAAAAAASPMVGVC